MAHTLGVDLNMNAEMANFIVCSGRSFTKQCVAVSCPRFLGIRWPCLAMSPLSARGPIWKCFCAGSFRRSTLGIFPWHSSRTQTAGTVGTFSFLKYNSKWPRTWANLLSTIKPARCSPMLLPVTLSHFSTESAIT